MKKEQFKTIIKEAMAEFLQSPEGEAMIGNIMLKAVDQAMKREIRFEDGKSEPGRIVEKTEPWNILDWLVKYLPHVEAAVRGCQSDAAAAKNRAAQAREMLGVIVQGMAGSGGLIENAEYREIAHVKEE